MRGRPARLAAAGLVAATTTATSGCVLTKEVAGTGAPARRDARVEHNDARPVAERGDV